VMANGAAVARVVPASSSIARAGFLRRTIPSRRPGRASPSCCVAYARRALKEARSSSGLMTPNNTGKTRAANVQAASNAPTYMAMAVTPTASATLIKKAQATRNAIKTTAVLRPRIRSTLALDAHPVERMRLAFSEPRLLSNTAWASVRE